MTDTAKATPTYADLLARHNQIDAAARAALASANGNELGLMKLVSVHLPFATYQHFKSLGTDEHYMLGGPRADWTDDGKERRYFIYYRQLFGQHKFCRRLLVGEYPGEEVGWFLPVDKVLDSGEHYRGERFKPTMLLPLDAVPSDFPKG